MKPILLTLLLLLLGCCLFAYALTIPYYTNQSAADQLQTKRWEMGKTKYYEAEAKLRTNKTVLSDIGSGLVVATVVVLLFLRITRISCFADFLKLQTPTRLSVLLCANAAWLLMIPGTWWYYSYRAMRGDYPPFADSIGIPIGAQTTFFLAALLPLNVLLAVLLVKAELPARLLLRPARYTTVAVLWETAFAGLVLLAVLLVAAFICDGDHVAIVSFLVLSYLLISMRAGHLSQAANT